MLQLVCRDTTTGALVRYDTRPPDWSASDGPDEFTHWAIHQREVDGGIGDGNPYPAARHDGFAILWTGGFSGDVCQAPRFWHINDETPAWLCRLDRPRQVQMRQRRCNVDLDELKRQWREKAESELNDA